MIHPNVQSAGPNSPLPRHRTQRLRQSGGNKIIWVNQHKKHASEIQKSISFTLSSKIADCAATAGHFDTSSRRSLPAWGGPKSTLLDSTSLMKDFGFSGPGNSESPSCARFVAGAARRAFGSLAATFRHCQPTSASSLDHVIGGRRGVTADGHGQQPLPYHRVHGYRLG